MFFTNTALKGHSNQVNFIQAGQPYQPLAGIKKGPPYSRRGGLYRVFIVGGSKLLP